VRRAALTQSPTLIQESSLRKSFMLAGAAALTIGVAGVAYAQTTFPAPAPTATLKVSPSKAGTKKKPKSVKVTLGIKNNVESKTTATTIQITFPKTLKVSTKGLDQCTKSDDVILAQTPAKACPKAIAGKGVAHALLSPYTATPAAFNFDVTSVVGKSELLFALKQTNGGINAVLHGKMSGRTLTVKIPSFLYNPGGTYSALSDLSTTISKKKGKHYLVSSVGCGYKVGVKLGYIPNPTPPAASSASTTAKASCKK